MFQKGNKYGFKKGVSGNPAGKPKAIVEVARVARERTLDALETLTVIMKDKDATASARVSAAVALLERGWGKAPQTVTFINNRNLADLSDNELINIALGADGATAGSDGAAEAPKDPNKLN
jgi:hypothetical protein